MYNYDFLKNAEKVIREQTNAIVEINNKSYNLSILITNKNVLFFHNVNVNNPLLSRGIHMPPEYLLELAIPIKGMEYECKDDNTYIVFKDSDIVIYNLNLADYLGAK